MHIIIRLLLSRHRRLLLPLLVCFVFLSSVSLAHAAVIETIMLKEPTKAGIVPVFLVVNSGQEPTIGTDVLIQYDPKKVQFQRVDFANMYPQQHDVRQDEQKNLIRFSGTNEYQKYQPVAGLFATVYFRFVKNSKKEELLFDKEHPPIWLAWSEGNTTDTNVVSVTGKDLLVQAPPPIRIDPEYGKGKVLGEFSEVQRKLLDQFGIVEEVTAVNFWDWRLIIVGLVLGGMSLVTLAFLMVRHRKKTSKKTNAVP